MPLLSTGDVSIHYEFDAAPQRPVLVLSNSLGTDLSMWEAQAARFGEHFSLLRYDSRGHGKSSVPAGPCSMEQLAGDVLALLDALQLDRVHYCGLSMGGMVGQWLGAHAPERLHSLVLADTAARCGDPDFWTEQINIALRRGMDAVMGFFVGEWFTSGFAKANPGAVERIAAMFLSTAPAGFAACGAAIRDMDYRAMAEQIRVPTLVAYGTHDSATPPADSKFLLDRIPGSMELILEAAHLSNVEAPETFTAGVLDFLLSH